MKIAIDISQIVYETGVSHYVRNLVSNLLSIDKENEYLLFAGSLRTRKSIDEFALTLKGKFELKIFPIPPTLSNLVWNRMHVFPVDKLIGKVDVVHTSDWSEPPSSASKVTTVHDLAPLLYPNLFPRDVVRNIVETHKYKLSWVRDESKRVIVPSGATKDDLVKLGFDKNVIRVIPEAVSDIFKPASENAIIELKRKYKISGKYLLAVGMDLRKNSQKIINAFNLSRAGKDLKLVFIGSPKYSNITESRNVRIVGRVPTEDLPMFYSGAEALVYPSLYEGFGLPILEAFACGCPVVTSDNSSMSEVAGNAAVVVDPHSPESITEGIERVLRGRKGFIEKGFKRVANYSWEVTAKETLKVYSEARL